MTHSILLVATMSVVTILLRFLPFLVFKKETPDTIVYLGKVLPAAIMGMLVVYCLKDVSLIESPYGVPELIAGSSVVLLQRWKHNSIFSIILGTIIYILLI